MMFGEMASRGMRDHHDTFFGLPVVGWVSTHAKPVKPQGYSRRRRILELRRAQYRQWRMGWGKPSKKS